MNEAKKRQQKHNERERRRARDKASNYCTENEIKIQNKNNPIAKTQTVSRNKNKTRRKKLFQRLIFCLVIFDLKFNVLKENFISFHFNLSHSLVFIWFWYSFIIIIIAISFYIKFLFALFIFAFCFIFIMLDYLLWFF